MEAYQAADAIAKAEKLAYATAQLEAAIAKRALLVTELRDKAKQILGVTDEDIVTGTRTVTVKDSDIERTAFAPCIQIDQMHFTMSDQCKDLSGWHLYYVKKQTALYSDGKPRYDLFLIENVADLGRLLEEIERTGGIERHGHLRNVDKRDIRRYMGGYADCVEGSYI